MHPLERNAGTYEKYQNSYKLSYLPFISTRNHLCLGLARLDINILKAYASERYNQAVQTRGWVLNAPSSKAALLLQAGEVLASALVSHGSSRRCRWLNDLESQQSLCERVITPNPSFAKFLLPSATQSEALRPFHVLN